MTTLQLRRSFVLTIAALLLVITSGCSSVSEQLTGQIRNLDQSETASPEGELIPNPDLSAEEVVRIQVEALQNNDDDDTGIEVTFRFASPSNKQATGPLNRFKRLVKNRVYRPMLNHKLAEYEPIEIAGDEATQRVTIIERNGQATVYIFALSKQQGAPCNGCWMTDSVTVVPTRKQDLKEI